MDPLDELYMNTVTVETYQGGGAYGDTWGEVSEPVRCLVDATRRLVRDTHGEEVVSEATIFMPFGTAELFPPGSRVHLEDRIAVVIARKRRDGAALDLPSHAEVTVS